jgi:ribosomal-protein-alanine N-acetyltransferase
MSGTPFVTIAGPASGALFAALHALCFPAAEAWREEAMTGLLVGPGTLGFLVHSEAESEPDGLALVQVAADEAEILTFGLRPEARGHGLAAQLLESVIAALEVRGIRSLFLEVAVDNAPARKLYVRRGFFEIGRRVGYYARGQGERVDALRLRLAIGC